MKYDPSVHHRHSIRLPGYDYSSNGAYFVTICAHNRKCLFGDIIDGKMVFNKIGNIIYNTWQWLEIQYGYTELDEWIIMPNHMHGIILIKHCRGGSRTAPTTRTAPATTKIKPLGQLVGAFKTVSTKQINQFRNSPRTQVWQRNYYEHIIRNEDEMNRIREYIFNNPLQWDLDELNPLMMKKGVLC